jgi:hypothetical protein
MKELLAALCTQELPLWSGSKQKRRWEKEKKKVVAVVV